MTEEMCEYISDHIDTAEARSVWQYKDKANWDAGREIYAQRIQILEDILERIILERSVSDSVGVQLELLAADYNLERLPNESDTDLRQRLIVKINTLLSSAQMPVLIASLGRSAGGRKTSIKQVFPIKLLAWIFVDDFSELTAEELSRINNTMQEIKAAGVGLDVGLQLNDVGFLFSDTLTAGENERGFAVTIGGTDGGAFSKLIE